MGTILRKDPRSMFPDLVDWLEEPFLTLRPYLGQAIRVEEYAEGDHFVVRAELAGIDPEKDLEVSVSGGYLTIHAERSSKTEAKHRSEFRYGSFSRTLALPASADPGTVTADYASGILTVSIGIKPEEKEAVKTIPVTVGK